MTGDSSGFDDREWLVPGAVSDCAPHAGATRDVRPHHKTSENSEVQLRDAKLSLTLKDLRSFMARMIAPLLSREIGYEIEKH